MKQHLFFLLVISGLLSTRAEGQLTSVNYDFTPFHVKLDESRKLSPSFGKDSSWFEGFEITQKPLTAIFIAVRASDIDPVLSILSKQGSWDTLIRLKRGRQPHFIPHVFYREDTLSLFVLAEGHKQKGNIEVTVLSENRPSLQQVLQPDTKDGLNMLYAASHYYYASLFSFKEDTSSKNLRFYTSLYRLFGKAIETARFKQGPLIPVLYNILDYDLNKAQITNRLKEYFAEIRQWALSRPDVKAEWVEQYGDDKLPAILLKRTDPLNVHPAGINYARIAIRNGGDYYFISLESDMMFY